MEKKIAISFLLLKLFFNSCLNSIIDKQEQKKILKIKHEQ